MLEDELLDVDELLGKASAKYELVLDSYHIDERDIGNDIWKDKIYSLVSTFLRSLVERIEREAREIKREQKRRQYEGVDSGKIVELESYPLATIELYSVEIPKLTAEKRFITWEVLEFFFSLIQLTGTL